MHATIMHVSIMRVSTMHATIMHATIMHVSIMHTAIMHTTFFFSHFTTASVCPCSPGTGERGFLMAYELRPLLIMLFIVDIWAGTFEAFVVEVEPEADLW